MTFRLQIYFVVPRVEICFAVTFGFAVALVGHRSGPPYLYNHISVNNSSQKNEKNECEMPLFLRICHTAAFVIRASCNYKTTSAAEFNYQFSRFKIRRPILMNET